MDRPLVRDLRVLFEDSRIALFQPAPARGHRIGHDLPAALERATLRRHERREPEEVRGDPPRDPEESVRRMLCGRAVSVQVYAPAHRE